MNGNYSSIRVGVLLRELVAAVLALAIVGAAIYQALAGVPGDGTLKDWGALVVGVYFGANIAARGESRRRAVDESNGIDQAAAH